MRKNIRPSFLDPRTKILIWLLANVVVFTWSPAVFQLSVILAYMSYWFPYDPYTFVANMYPSTDYTDPSGIYSTDPQVAKALAIMSDEDAKKLIGGLYNTDDPVVVQKIYTTALDSANESSVVIPLNYRNEYAVFNNEVIESYTFNSIPNHVDVAAIHLK